MLPQEIMYFRLERLRAYNGSQVSSCLLEVSGVKRLRTFHVLMVRGLPGGEGASAQCMGV